jgi:hypothetical protein
MNHICTEYDLQSYRNLWGEMIIQTLNDLGIDTTTGALKMGRNRNWVGRFIGFHDALRAECEKKEKPVSYVSDWNAIKMWAVGCLEAHAMRELSGESDPEQTEEVAIELENRKKHQLRYNYRVKRWLDQVYAIGDPMLTAMIVTENEGMITEAAESAGMMQRTARQAEKRVRQLADEQVVRLLTQLEASSTAKEKPFRITECGLRNEIITTKEDVS